ncbi:unnamed protein product [Ectocarpus sp. 4 AP-2014]
MLRCIVRVAAVLPAAFAFAQDHGHQDPQQQRLGVVVPAYDGDLARAVSSLERWPTKCSPLTLENADLVLYYAEQESSATASALERISSTAGRCFLRTRIVYANLAEEDDIYPQGPSVMFYNMFLDEDVRASLSEYDALSIIEWDVLVASDNSFEELYHAAFRVNEEFWVKGSNLEGTSFHSNADAIEMWQVLGHINGNAIYNNDDTAFVEYVEYTRSRWGYEHPYDVALWMTISDFPYSWPLYQRYSNKFVVTNLISSVGYEHVNHDTVSDAVAGKTLFIHGSSVDEGNVASYEATEADASVDVAATQRHLTEDVPKWKAQEKWRNNTVPKYVSPYRIIGWVGVAGDTHKIVANPLGTPARFHEGQRILSNCDERMIGQLRLVAFGVASALKYVLGKAYRCWRTDGNLLISPVLTTYWHEFLAGRCCCALTVVCIRTRWKRNQKWKTKKDDGVPNWRANQKWKKRYEDSPDEEGCMDGCEYTSKDGTKGRVCDSNCSRGDTYGTLGCDAKSGKYGADCRACYNDIEKARKQDTPGNRAIMCSSKMPVDVYRRRMTAVDESDPLLVARDLEALQEDASSPSEEEEHRQLTEDVPKWKAREKWRSNTVPKCVFRKEHRQLKDDVPKWKAQEKWRDNTVPKWKRTQKWKTKKDDVVPKWRANQKWKEQYEDSPDEEGCLDGCEYTSKDGTKGRVCDSNCSRGDAYGTLGCGAKDGKYGADCRACYNDVEKARKQDTPGNRAIMCSTGKPVDVYRRRLSADHEDYSFELAQLMKAEDSKDKDSEDGFEPRMKVEVGGREKAIRFFEAAAERTYLGEVERGNLCAFVGGRVGEEAMLEVTVKSILQFMPGMKVAIAAAAEGLDAYERSIGRLPGVTVSGTQNPATAALYADKYCSFSELILYVKPGSVLSRSFTPKDTHSPRGDLLVVHAGSQGSYHDTELSRLSSSVVGFEAPSFTQGTDLMLPGDANYYLREALGLKIGSEGLQGDGDGDAVVALQEFVDFDQVSAVPQVLAAVAYSRKTPGVWFVDPRGWVGQNLFKEASIWDIPLVKPRFTCTIAADKLDSASPKTAEVLQSSVNLFANGGKCANGLIADAP